MNGFTYRLGLHRISFYGAGIRVPLISKYLDLVFALS